MTSEIGLKPPDRLTSSFPRRLTVLFIIFSPVFSPRFNEANSFELRLVQIQMLLVAFFILLADTDC